MLDQFGRDINYLRISVTDRCNLRCTYCMPLEGLRFAPPERLLTPREIGQVVEAAVTLGFGKFRLTGGEPLLRRDIADIVREVRAVEGVREVALTTNGVLLPKVGESLVEAGLDRVNLHIDTLDDKRLQQVMRFNDLRAVWKGIEEAERLGLTPIKLNTVVVSDLNDEDVVPMARLTVERGWHVRFIELMPLGGGECAQYSQDRYVSNVDTKERLEREIGPLEPVANQNPWDESRNFRFAGAEGIVGFISPVSQPYCGTCNRMRLTAEGRFHLCLLKNDTIDLREILREGGNAEDIVKALRAAVETKPVGHELSRGRSNEAFAMHQMGG